MSLCLETGFESSQRKDSTPGKKTSWLWKRTDEGLGVLQKKASDDLKTEFSQNLTSCPAIDACRFSDKLPAQL
jgi:hypothetical protein